MMVEQLFLAVPPGCLRFVIVVSPDHTHLLFQWLYPTVLKVLQSFYNTFILSKISFFRLFRAALLLQRFNRISPYISI